MLVRQSPFVPPQRSLLPQVSQPLGFTDPIDLMSGQQIWRDFGIHPVEMLRRMTVERAPAMGSPVQHSRPADAMVMETLHRQLGQVVQGMGNLEELKSGLEGVARGFGLKLEFCSGAPTVNWAGDGVLEIRESGGPSALHEMVHAVQCVVGGGAALASLAVDKFRQLNGRAPVSMDELQPALQALTDADRKQAFDGMVRPMEQQAYSRFEETAFHSAGMFGRKSRDLEFYRTHLGETLDAFCQGYAEAKLDTEMGAKIYGGIGHVARTHGETALLLGLTGYGYHRLTRAAMAVHPLLAVPMMAPLGYMLYRSLVSG